MAEGFGASSQTDWVVVLSASHSAALTELWNVASVQVCRIADEIWVRGKPVDEDAYTLVCSLPATERYELLSDGQLRIPGQRLPVASLPSNSTSADEATWMPLRALFNVTAPTAIFAGKSPQPVQLKLTRSDCVVPSNVIVTTFAHWFEFVIAAPRLRLEPLSFAVAANRTTVVRGCPLPTLPGRHYVERAGVAVPAGYAWAPTVAAETIARHCELVAGDLALFTESGMWHLVPESEFVGASRSSVRQTRNGFAALGDDA